MKTTRAVKKTQCNQSPVIIAAMPSWSAGILLVNLASLLARICAQNGNATADGYVKMDKNEFKTKDHRLITFNTDEDSAISVELSFSVPFLTIPVKKTVDTAKGALANVNVDAMVLTGIIVLGVSFAMPFILRLLSKKSASKQSDDKSRREDFPNWTDFFSHIDYAFARDSIDASSCLQQFICRLVKDASVGVARGSATSRQKIIDAIAGSDWFRRIIDDTPIGPAVRDGLKNASCSKRYHKCKIGQRNMETLFKDFIKRFSLKRK